MFLEKKLKSKFYFIAFVLALPANLIFWTVILVGHLFFGKRLFWDHGLWSEFKSKDGKYAGITLCHGGFLEGGHSEFVMRHEQIHIEQFEGANVFWSNRLDCFVFSNRNERRKRTVVCSLASVLAPAGSVEYVDSHDSWRTRILRIISRRGCLLLVRG